MTKNTQIFGKNLNRGLDKCRKRVYNKTQYVIVCNRMSLSSRWRGLKVRLDLSGVKMR